MLHLKSEINVSFYIEGFKKVHPDMEDAARAFEQALNQFKNREFYDAIPNFTEACTILTGKLGEGKSLFEGHLHRCVANCFFLLSKLQGATENMKKAVEAYKSVGGSQGAYFLDEAYGMLAEILIEDFEFDPAIAEWNNQIELKKKISGDESYELAQVLVKKGRALFELGSDEECEETLKSAIKMLESYKSTKPLAQGHILEAKAWMSRIGDEEEREADDPIEKMKKAAEWFEKHGDQLMAADIMFEVLGLDGIDIENAQTAFDKCKEIWSEYYGEKSFKLANCYEGLGVVQQSDEEWQTAIDLYNQALEIMKNYDSQFSLGSTYQNLGSCYVQLAKFPEALEAFENSLKAYGDDPDNDEYTDVIHSIGEVFYYQNQKDKCLDYYLRAEARSASGEEGVVADPIYTEYVGRVYAEMGDYKKGFEYLDRAIQTYQDRIEEEDEEAKVDGIPVDALRVFDLKAQLYIEAGDYDAAIQEYQKCIKIELKFAEGNAEDSSLSRYYAGLALALAKKGGLTKALETAMKAESVLTTKKEPEPKEGEKKKEKKREKTEEDDGFEDVDEDEEEDPNYIDHASALEAIAYVLILQGKPKKAIPKLEQAIPMIEQAMDLVPINKIVYVYEYSEAFALLGWAQGKIGEYEEGIKNLNLGIEKKAVNFTENHPDIGRFNYWLGLVYKAKQDYPNAVKAFERAVEIGKKHFGDEHPEFSEAESQLNAVRKLVSKDQ